MRTDKIVIAVQAVGVGAVTLVALALVRDHVGRGAFWLVGLALLLLAGFALFRLCKKV